MYKNDELRDNRKCTKINLRRAKKWTKIQIIVVQTIKT